MNFNKEVQLENNGALNIFVIFTKKIALQGNFLWVHGFSQYAMSKRYGVILLLYFLKNYLKNKSV